MRNLTTSFLLAVSALAMLATEAKSSSGKSRGGSSGLSFAETYLLTEYAFSTANWPKTKMSMSEFATQNVATMWKNRPAQAISAICINGPWAAKNWDNVSPPMTVSYFKKTFWSKKVRQ